jgi:predicted nucleic acid-binding protein
LPSTALAILIEAFSLDRGEQEALLLMQQHPDALFITDDAAARFAAVQLGFRVHGTMGMLVRAVRMNQLTADQVLSLLEQIPSRSTLFVQPALLAEFIEGFKKKFGK